MNTRQSKAARRPLEYIELFSNHDMRCGWVCGGMFGVAYIVASACRL